MTIDEIEERMQELAKNRKERTEKFVNDCLQAFGGTDKDAATFRRIFNSVDMFMYILREHDLIRK